MSRTVTEGYEDIKGYGVFGPADSDRLVSWEAGHGSMRAGEGGALKKLETSSSQEDYLLKKKEGLYVNNMKVWVRWKD